MMSGLTLAPVGPEPKNWPRSGDSRRNALEPAQAKRKLSTIVASVAEMATYLAVTRKPLARLMKRRGRRQKREKLARGPQYVATSRRRHHGRHQVETPTRITMD